MGTNNLFGIPNNNIPQAGHTIIADPRQMPIVGQVGTIPNYNLSYYRLGDRMIGHGQFTTGTLVNSGSVKLQLPPGLTINKKVKQGLDPSLNLGQYMGIWTNLYIANGALFADSNINGMLVYDGLDDTGLYFSFRVGSPTNNYVFDTPLGLFVSNGVSIDFSFDVPISQWAVE